MFTNVTEVVNRKAHKKNINALLSYSKAVFQIWIANIVREQSRTKKATKKYDKN